MSLASWAIQRPVSVVVMALAVMIYGLVTLVDMPTSLFPKVSLPFVTVQVQRPGVAVGELETSVVLPIEREFSLLAGLSRQMSFVRPGVVEFVVGFRFGLDGQAAVARVREALERSGVQRSGAGDLHPPLVRAVDPAATPVLTEAIATHVPVPRVLELVDTIKGLPGVASVKVFGMPRTQRWLRLNVETMHTLGLPPIEVWRQLTGSTPGGSWGYVSAGNAAQIPLRAEPIATEQLVLPNGQPLPLASIGAFGDEPDPLAPRVFVDGRPGVVLEVFRASDANTLEVVDALRASLETWRQKVRMSPSGSAEVLSQTVLDQSLYIRESAREVWVALIWGGLFAMVTVAFALRDVRSALITGTALPISVCGTFVFMTYLGFSLNMLTLLALALAIGLLIDDAVIVRESISKELEKGRAPRVAAIKGTARVFAPVVATTACVLGVFLPVALMEGLVGQFFREFGGTLCVAMVLSTLVAFTVDPMLSARFAGVQRAQPSIVAEDQPHSRRRLWGRRCLKMVLGAVDWCYRHPAWTIGTALGLFLVSVVLAQGKGVDFMTSEDKSQLVVDLVGQPGEGPVALDERAQHIAHGLKSVDGVAGTVAFVGSGSDPFRATIRVQLKNKQDRSQSHLDVAQDVRQSLRAAGQVGLVREPPPIEGVGGEPPLSLYLFGEDLEQLQNEARGLLPSLAAVPGVGSVVIDTAATAQGLRVGVRNGLARSQGVPLNAIEATGRIVGFGLEVPSPTSTGPSYRVGLEQSVPSSVSVFQPQEFVSETLERWRKVLVPAASGTVPLASLVELQPALESFAIDREGGQRKVVLYGAPDGTASLTSILGQWQQIAHRVPLPIKAEIGGDQALVAELQENFGLAILGGVLCIFVMLALIYESLWLSVVVVVSLPLAATGGLLGLVATGERLAMGTMIGMVLLLGLAAKNAILLADGVLWLGRTTLLAQSHRVRVLLAVKARARPILMTSVALGVGMVPTVFMDGAGSEFRAPMALSIIWGLVSSTALSFFVIPALFALIGRIQPKP